MRHSFNELTYINSIFNEVRRGTSENSELEKLLYFEEIES